MPVAPGLVVGFCVHLLPCTESLADWSLYDPREMEGILGSIIESKNL